MYVKNDSFCSMNASPAGFQYTAVMSSANAVYALPSATARDPTGIIRNSADLFPTLLKLLLPWMMSSA